MLARQEPDVVFTPHADTEASLAMTMATASFDSDGRGLRTRGGGGGGGGGGSDGADRDVGGDHVVGAHLAVVR